MKDNAEDPRPPCMVCDEGKMEYTGCIITTPTGIPVVKCNVCGATAEVTFPFGAKKVAHAKIPEKMTGMRREILFLDEANSPAEPSDEVRALFDAIMDEYEKKNGLHV